MEPQNLPTKPVMDVAPPQIPAEPRQTATISTDKAADKVPQKPPLPATAAPSTQSTSQPLRMHAPPVSEDNASDSSSQNNARPLPETKKEQAEQKNAASYGAKTPHPAREIIVLTVLVMIILCSLAVLVYLNA